MAVILNDREYDALREFMQWRQNYMRGEGVANRPGIGTTIRPSPQAPQRRAPRPRSAASLPAPEYVFMLLGGVAGNTLGAEFELLHPLIL